MDPHKTNTSEKFKVKIIAAFLGVKFLPKLIAVALNNFNPKLVLSENGVEYRAFILTGKLTYPEIDMVDILLANRTTNVYLFRNNSMFTISANTNNKEELHKCLQYLKSKGCTLTEKAEHFYRTFSAG